ncbi:hypothetical protein [Kitasatospora sp. NPDC059571]|uniref:phage baseplate protein n=1 Tax=Kitasatospora sp. NPDC059571 TaxID=3346871 RepID=UPI0036AC5918
MTGRRPIGRRRLLAAGGALGALAAGGSALVAAAGRRPAARSGADTSADVATPGDIGPRFTLSAASEPLVRQVPLAGSATVMQSFGFDVPNGRILVAQIQKRAEGNLRLSRLTLDGDLDGEMVLQGFGHGGQIGVEPDGDGTWVWVETDPAVTGRSAWGRRIARLRFEDGATVGSGDRTVRTWDIVPGGTRLTCSVDTRFGQLAVRYSRAGAVRFRVLDLASVKAGRPAVRYDLPAPPPHATAQNPHPDSQGFAVYGSTLYTLEGNPYSEANTAEQRGNAYLTCTDMAVRGGRVVESRLITDGLKLPFREPEGVAVLLPDGNGGPERLAFGFASIDPDGNRLASIYAKRMA